MCRQKGTSCAGALAGTIGGGSTDASQSTDDGRHAGDYVDDDDDVRATTIKILLFPNARNNISLLCCSAVVSDTRNFRSNQIRICNVARITGVITKST